jgi:hypothetical protein
MSGTRAISTTSRRELSSIFFFLQGKAPKEIHFILTETLACFLPGRAKDLSAPPVLSHYKLILNTSVGYCFNRRISKVNTSLHHLKGVLVWKRKRCCCLHTALLILLIRADIKQCLNERYWEIITSVSERRRQEIRSVTVISRRAH